jgi:hypothetical protein
VLESSRDALDLRLQNRTYREKTAILSTSTVADWDAQSRWFLRASSVDPETSELFFDCDNRLRSHCEKALCVSKNMIRENESSLEKLPERT